MSGLQNENTKRIARNTLLLYVRMLFGMFVSLYTSRVVLEALGVEDYGIYNVVGGFVAMFGLISTSLSSSISRFLTFEMGRGDIGRLKSVFSTSLVIQSVLAVAVLLVAETVGVWFVNHKMTIPPERLYAANWVFQCSVFSFMLNLMSMPYNASVVAHERMATFAYVGIAQVLVNLGIVLFIAHVPFAPDRLIVYALLLVAMGVCIQLFYVFYCRRCFEECRMSFSLDKRCWREMGGFAGWNFIGCTARILKDQGVNVLLNLFYGPMLNAARGIAMSVNSVVYAFAGNFMTALNPQITKSYASGDRDYMMSLVERGSRFSFYILAMLALPLLLETDFVLALWLKHYPAHTVGFVRLVLLVTLCDVLSNTLITLQSATGRIRTYQLAVGGMLLLNFPLSYVCLRVGFPPESVLWVALLVSVCCLALRLVFLRRMVGLSVSRYLRRVCLNVLAVFAAALVLPALLCWQMPVGWGRFAAVTLACLVGCALSAYGIGCSRGERVFVARWVGSLKNKIAR